MPTLARTPRPTYHHLAGSARRAFARAGEAAETRPWLAFGLLSGIYFATFFCLSYMKLLWLDELITLHIARLNSAAAVWHAVASGADPNPPLTHLLVMVCRRLFGEHAWALRLPAGVGYWVGMLALFLFLKRRIPVAWALAGTVFSMTMGAFEWSYESRSYAIFYGFAMLAFYCWSRSADTHASRRGRQLALAGMTLSLAGGICANYFAVLAFFPVAAAELVRTVEVTIRDEGRSKPTAFLRHVRWSVWLALVAAGSPLLLFRPAIQRSIALYAGYAFNRASLDQALHGYLDLVEWMLYPLFGLMLLALLVHLLRQLDTVSIDRLRPGWLGRLAAVPGAREPLLSLAEAAGVSMLVTYPLLGLALASLRGGMLSPRFVIPVCFGCAIAGVLFAFRTFGHLPAAGTILLGIALAGFGYRTTHSGWIYEVRKESFARLLDRIPPPEYPGQPLAVSDDLLVLPLEFYAPQSIASRIVFPLDFTAIMRDRGEASAEVNLWNGRRSIYKFPVVPLADLQQSSSTYLVLTSGREWLVEDLNRHWYEVQPLQIDMQSADTYGFFSPVTHGRPVLFRAAGDRFDHPYSETLPFEADDALPSEP